MHAPAMPFDVDNNTEREKMLVYPPSVDVKSLWKFTESEAFH
jgi:hypothetical protein